MTANNNSKSKPQLPGRPADFFAYVARMQQASQDYRHPDGKFAGQNPLNVAELRDKHSFLNGVYHSWAAVMEVMSFYQEQIVKEGYLATADEAFSVQQLAAQLGTQGNHYLSATTHIAFTLMDNTDRLEYVIPQGTKVQNIPKDGKPVLFETTQDFVGKPGWNQLSLLPQPQTDSCTNIPEGAGYCHIAKGEAVLKPKQSLCLSGQVAGEPRDFLLQVVDVLKLKDGSSVVFWRLAANNRLPQIKNATLWHLPKTFKLFGHDAKDWQSLAPKSQQSVAKPLSGLARISLSTGQVTTIAALDDTRFDSTHFYSAHFYTTSKINESVLLAAGEQGIYRTLDGGLSWHQLKDKLTKRPITCLFSHEQVLYAGGHQGHIICSFDYGDNWVAIRGSKPQLKEAKKHIHPGLLPTYNITAMTAIRVDFKDGAERDVLLLGTLKGLFFSVDEGRYWQQAEALFYYRQYAMPEGTQVHDLHRYQDQIIAATSHGVYFATINHHNLNEKKTEEVKAKTPSFLSRHFSLDSAEKKQFTQANEHTEVLAAITVDTQIGAVTVLATKKEVYQIIDDQWQAMSQGIARDSEDRLPVIHGLYEQEGKLLLTTHAGLYSTHEIGKPWQLLGRTPLYQRLTQDQWASELDKGSIPAECHTVLAQLGLPISDNPQVLKEDTDNRWCIREPHCDDIVLTCLPLKWQVAVRQADASLQTIDNIYPASHYREALLDQIQTPETVRQLFAQFNRLLGPKVRVSERYYGESWVLHDLASDTAYLLEVDAHKLQVFLLPSCHSLLLMANDELLCAAPSQHIRPAQWPNFALASHHLALDKAITPQQLGQVVMLTQDQPRGIQRRYSAKQSQLQTVSAFGKKAEVLQVKVAEGNLNQFNRKQAQLYAGGGELFFQRTSALQHAPIRINQLLLEAKAPLLPSGHLIAVTGKRAIVQLSQPLDGGPIADWQLSGVDHKGLPSPLKRTLILQLKLGLEAVNASLSQNVIDKSLYQLLLKHQIQLGDNAVLHPVGKDAWMLTQSLFPHYLLQLKDDQLLVFQEYHFPVLRDEPQFWVLDYQGQAITINKQNNLLATWLPSQDSSADISEIAEVSRSHYSADGKLALTLSQNLKHCYDPVTVRCYGNLVHAVHGETVNDEIMGSTSGAKPFQQFALRRHPLTVYEDQNGQLQHHLKVRNRRDQLLSQTQSTSENWVQTDSILQSSAEQRHYQVFFNEQGAATLMFGDGEHGSLPHPGIENMLASYRFGGGARGNLPAGAIKLLRSKPLGLKAAFNPVPAVGGADLLAHEQMKQQASQSVQYDLIVSPDDCLRFAQRFPGVAIAQLTPLVCEGQSVWVINIDSAPEQKPCNAMICKELQQAITAKLTQKTQVTVVPAARRYCAIALRVWVHELGQWDRLSQVLQERIVQWFQQAPNLPGCSVERAWLEAMVQQLSGIAGCEVTGLTDLNHHQSDLEQLPAIKPHFNAQRQIVPAVRWLIEAEHIQLTLGGQP